VATNGETKAERGNIEIKGSIVFKAVQPKDNANKTEDSGKKTILCRIFGYTISSFVCPQVAQWNVCSPICSINMCLLRKRRQLKQLGSSSVSIGSLSPWLR